MRFKEQYPIVLLIGILCVVRGDSRKLESPALDMEKFVGDVRRALRNQWDILQNLHYLSLGIKVRMVQVEGHLQSINERLNSDEYRTHDKDTRHSRDESCSNGQEGGRGRGRGRGGRRRDNSDSSSEIQELLATLRNVTQTYATLVNGGVLCDGKGTSGGTKEPLSTTTMTPSIDKCNEEIEEERKEGRKEGGNGEDENERMEKDNEGKYENEGMEEGKGKENEDLDDESEIKFENEREYETGENESEDVGKDESMDNENLSEIENEERGGNGREYDRENDSEDPGVKMKNENEEMEQESERENEESERENLSEEPRSEMKNENEEKEQESERENDDQEHEREGENDPGKKMKNENEETEHKNERKSLNEGEGEREDEIYPGSEMEPKNESENEREHQIGNENDPGSRTRYENDEESEHGNQNTSSLNWNESQDHYDGKNVDISEHGGSINVSAQLGSNAALNCRLDQEYGSEQAAWIRVKDQNWLSQGTHKVAANERRITAGFSNDGILYYQLYIEDIRREDEGAYECHLSTSPAAPQTIWLTVTEPPPPPPWLAQNPTAWMGTEGEGVTLPCRAESSPLISTTWYRGGLEVTPSAWHHITTHGDLTIRRVRLSDAGVYTCQESNSKGRIEGVVLLKVEHPLKILRGPRDRVVMVGEHTTFRCRVKGDGPSVLRLDWMKDGALLNASQLAVAGSRVSRQPNNALVITSARLQDSGVYTCFASTLFYTASASATLIVREKFTSKATAVKVITTTTTTTSPTPLHLDYCPPPYERIQKFVCILEITHRKLSWVDAAEYCRNEGGQLAWEREGTNVLQNFLEERYGLTWTTKSSYTRWPFWVGGREGEDGEWRWSDGTLISPNLWAPQHRRPTGRRAMEDDWCLVLDGYQDYKAAALPCSSKRYFLCRLIL